MNRADWRSRPAAWTGEARTGYRRARYAVDGERYDVTVRLTPQGRPAPLVVVLDGALHFDAVAAAAAALALRPEKTGVGPMIVAGIATGAGWSHDAERRARDLVPGTGYAERLFDLLRERLLPDVAMLPGGGVSETAIFGHSFGGLFALDALCRPDTPFAATVAISPSLWRRTALAGGLGTLDPSRRLFVASGSNEAAINADLADLPAGIARRIYADEDHGSVVFAAIPAALRFLSGIDRP